VVEEKRTSAAWMTPTFATRDSRTATWRWRDRAARATGFGGEEEASQDAPRFVKGERVRHRRFGAGTIEGLTGAGKDLKVAVRFDDQAVGLKQLLVAYAGLERAWEEE
jgi:hypothetical protein